ncbi:hypothetical protein A2715_01870 [Candidatus Woesebacteria bacterium RIFCSPHIGHO2_01_FULL_39_32]|uniref:Zn-dependent hydrolase of the beta-lactamase fold-like protein n=2 Tax=Candidatus Woeseibacteriota TaxID=1752722 RepID=A0A0G0PRQ1_9BACT|nr:MAG: Zn-dependent hydrolase of the beta-lactamase fold-like protein [Candidatus Woesebacteria bacterium GW2011_GWA1_39_8]OGM03638.1 MAG: hypothetical protein A2124_00575 [Candidatus Woesebacteria bacterium GWB1_37_5]OGM23905.1 MAG: hypothetical protein A2715_01870 [Candidatus Woesebacteria bacterium RIFCSPHIGHO2_01_FULL_39_32]OGM37412.1 MAG: hypothetical protein A3F01_03105 [Candidatus Woesebacteria bacterium RIFCSPHIGHO2_12_FULL_38_11]OGM64094.1 MAG: hypothetical protein A2893_03110 [Candid
MDISYLGHASFRMKGRRASVVTDPYAPYVGFKFPKVEADIVTISHNHEDHNQSQLVSNVKRVVAGPGEYEISGVSIIGIPSFHDEEKGAKRGTNTIYVFEIDDLRVVHLGDLGHKLSEEVLEDIGTVDILMVPVGGFYTIGPTEASDIVRNIEPTITIPMHYKVSGLDQSTFGSLAAVDDFLKEVALPTENLDKLSIKKGDITEEKKVVVLERR